MNTTTQPFLMRPNRPACSGGTRLGGLAGRIRKDSNERREWAREAVRALLRRCLQAALTRLQDDADALLLEIARRM